MQPVYKFSKCTLYKYVDILRDEFRRPMTFEPQKYYRGEPRPITGMICLDVAFDVQITGRLISLLPIARTESICFIICTDVCLHQASKLYLASSDAIL